MQRCSFLAHVWDGNEHEENRMQPVKHEFVAKNGKFAANIMEWMCSIFFMKHSSHEIDYDSKSNCNISKCHIKSTEILMEKLKRGFPVPFVINDNDESLFLIKN